VTKEKVQVWLPPLDPGVRCDICRTFMRALVGSRCTRRVNGPRCKGKIVDERAEGRKREDPEPFVLLFNKN
jgi:hypothetical protein